MNETSSHCPVCETETMFVTPECADGHGQACLDLACTACGCAVVLVDLGPEPSPVRLGHAA